MKRILRIGIDIHRTNYTLCAIEPRFDGNDIIYAEGCDILCGYEVGCQGFSLYHELVKKGIQCAILAPTTMLTHLKWLKSLEPGRLDRETLNEYLTISFHQHTKFYPLLRQTPNKLFL